MDQREDRPHDGSICSVSAFDGLVAREHRNSLSLSLTDCTDASMCTIAIVAWLKLGCTCTHTLTHRQRDKGTMARIDGKNRESDTRENKSDCRSIICFSSTFGTN